MNIAALSPNASIRAAALAAEFNANSLPSTAQLEMDRKSLGASETAGAKGRPGTPSPAEVKKVASQFEAIILRQLLEPSMAPIMSGGMGGGGASGGGMYGYLLTDTLATSLAQGGGLGWARMLEKQLSPTPTGADINFKSDTNS